jgi:hypothetical protein
VRAAGLRESTGRGSPLSLFKVVTLASRRIGRVERLIEGRGSAVFSFVAGRVQMPVSGSQTGSLGVVMKGGWLMAEMGEAVVSDRHRLRQPRCQILAFSSRDKSAPESIVPAVVEEPASSEHANSEERRPSHA